LCLMGTQSPLPKKGAEKGGRSPQFSAHVYCGQTAAWIKMPLGMEIGLSPGDFVLGGGPSPPNPHLTKKGRSPQFSAHVYCRQTAEWIKMPLGTDVDLAPGDFVFDGDAATRRKRAHPPHPIFCSCLLWPSGWIYEDATWYGSRPRPRLHCIRWGS